MCRKQKDILVRRSDDRHYADCLGREFAELGAEAEVKEQKKIAGHNFF